MRYFTLLLFLFTFSSLHAQFKVTDKGLIIMVSDGTDDGRNSKLQGAKDIPISYDQVGSKPSASKGNLVFKDPIRELGMKNCIQAAAFLERPKYGKSGFMLIFSINDSIGGRQGTLIMNGETYKGVYRLVKQKTSSNEVVPKNMTSYQIVGTFFLLGIS